MGRELTIALVALAISLAVNVFAIGFFSGRLIVDRHDGPPPGPPIEAGAGIEQLNRPLGVMRNVQALSPRYRAQFRSAISQSLPEVRERRIESMRLRDELAILVHADDWDQDAVREKLATLNAVEAEQRAILHDAFVTAVAALPPEERKRFVNARGRGERSDRMRDRMRRRRDDAAE